MASSSSLLSENHLECSICLDVFTDPVSTPCGHNFCMVCLKACWDNSSRCRCPVCKEEFSRRPELRVNTFISGLAAQFKKPVPKSRRAPAKGPSRPKKVLCDSCREEKQEAVKSCLDCGVSYCDAHLMPHTTAAKLKKHKLMEPVENLEDYICQKHERPLELFCRDDQICVCRFCWERDHKTHSTVPIEEELQVKKIQMGRKQTKLQQMIQDKEKIIKEIRGSVDLNKRITEQEKADSVEVFRALVRCIERSQAELLELMEEKQRAAERQAEEFIKELEQEITELKRRDTELEQLSHTEDHLHLLQVYPSLCRPPPTKNRTDVSIKVDLSVESLRRALSHLQEEFSKEMEKSVMIGQHQSFESDAGSDRKPVKEAQQWSYLGELWKTEDESSCRELRKVQQYAVDVTLDPVTANPYLILSDGGKRLAFGNMQQNLPDTPERFDCCPCVLGKEGFSSGRFYFEVLVRGKTDWDLGVVTESCDRKGQITVSPEGGYWMTFLRNETQYAAMDTSFVPLSLKQAPQKVGVFVDYEEGLVSFYDVEARSHIYSFTGQSFSEKLYPLLSPYVDYEVEQLHPEGGVGVLWCWEGRGYYQHNSTEWKAHATGRPYKASQLEITISASDLDIYNHHDFLLPCPVMGSTNSVLSEDQLLCSICLDVFTDPVSTPCGHNYCMACLKEFWDSCSRYQCPVCKEEFSRRPELRVNTFISGLAAQFKESLQLHSGNTLGQLFLKPKRVLCDSCTDKKLEAVKSCLDCGVSYCEAHLMPHHTAVKLKKHKLMEPVENLEDYICQKHERPLELFCKVDQMCICQFCTEGDHRCHSTVPIEKESRAKKAELGKTQAEVQQMIHDRLKKIEEMKHSVYVNKKNTEKEIADSVEVFSALVRCIVRSQAELLELMEEKQEAAERQAEEFIKDLEQEITELKRRDTELEQLSHTEDHLHLLQVYPSLCRPLRSKNWSSINVNTSLSVETARRALSRLQEALDRKTESLVDMGMYLLDGQILCGGGDLRKISQFPTLDGAAVVLQGSSVLRFFVLTTELERIQQYAGVYAHMHHMTTYITLLCYVLHGVQWGLCFCLSVDVTLDPDTAHPELILSADGKQVRHGDSQQNLPENPRRFNSSPCVLGKEGFSSGRFYYEVQVKRKAKWVLGVATESGNRKGEITANPEDGYWSVCLRNKTEYEALDSPSALLCLKQAPQKVGVFVDYEEGLVSFYDVEARSHIYSFTAQSFTERLYPYFNPCFNDGRKNVAPLIITPIVHYRKLLSWCLCLSPLSVMASSSSLLSEDQLRCSICLDVFTDPVTTPCGHNFCLVCLSECWDSSSHYQCRVCKMEFTQRPQLSVNTFISGLAAQFKKSVQVKSSRAPEKRIKPQVLCDFCCETKCAALKSCLTCMASSCKTHLELHHTVASFRKHKLVDPVENLEDYICQKHERPLELFCRDDQTCVCQFCTEGDHRAHRTVPIEEEIQVKKIEIGMTQAELQQMIQGRINKIEEIKHSVELHKEATEQEKADSVEVFRALVRCIERSQAKLLELMEAKQKAAERQAEEFITELEQEITELKRRDTELEQLSHTEDHLHLLQVYPSLCRPPPTKDWTGISINTPLSVENLRGALSQLQKELSKEKKKLPEIKLKRMPQYAVDVTLDPDTAHPYLVLSDDGKQVRLGHKRQKLPKNPKRFDECASVLGTEGFSSGKFYYEVQVSGKTAWDLGVTTESSNRKGPITLSPENGYWTVWLRNETEYKALDSPRVPLSLRQAPQKVGVFVDYEEGLVSFYDVEVRSHIYSFTAQSFTEKIYPYFSPPDQNRVMASSSSLLSEDQLLCSICLDVFTDPVSTPCGHNFCMVCLKECWDSSSRCRCPVCKEEFSRRPELRVNTFISGLAAQFKESVQVKPSRAPEPPPSGRKKVLCDSCSEEKQEAVKSCLDCGVSYCDAHLMPHKTTPKFMKHKLMEPVENLEDYICQKHERPLELFCRDDQTCVCQFCTEGDHRSHSTVPIEEEIRVKKIQLGTTQAQVKQMIRERLKKITEIQHSVDLSKKNTEQEKADSVEVFRALVRCIERSQAELLELMEEKQKAAERQAEELINELDQEITELKRRHTELEQLSHTEDHLHLLQICSPPYTRNWTGVRINTHLNLECLRRALSQLQEGLSKETEKLVGMELKRIQQYAVDVTLDRRTAHPDLILSDGWKKVRLGDRRQDLPDNRERFNECACVLGKRGFSSGRFYYEVQVRGNTEWDLGVTKESSNRKGEITLSPKNGYWTVWLRNKTEYTVLDSPRVHLFLKQAPQKVGVFVDYEEGLVSFYDVENRSHIYSFTGQSFTERLYPYFSPAVNYKVMASSSSLLSEDQLLCSICLDVFTDPVSTPCGHNFCMVCLKECWDSSSRCQCPVCKEEFSRRPELRVNTFISGLAAQFKKSDQVKPSRAPEPPPSGRKKVLCDSCSEEKQEAVKSCLDCGVSYCDAHLMPHKTTPKFMKHKLMEPVENLEDYICQKHERPLELFCRDDQTCVSIQLGTTQAQVKQMIQERLKKITEIQHSVDLSKKNTEQEKADSVEVFRALVRCIERSQAELLELMEEKQRAAERQAEELIKELEQEITELKRRDTELEQLSHTEDHLHLLQICSPPYTRNWTGVRINTHLNLERLRRALSQLQEGLSKETEKLVGMELKRIQQYAVDVTLDRRTAYPALILSDGWKKVRLGNRRQDLPDNRERFDECACVLGKEGFSSGRFYYEVQVKGKTAWDLGVTKESSNRKGEITISPEDGYWTLWLRNKTVYEAQDSPPVPLYLKQAPRKVGVFVDYEEGLVSFYDVQASSHIYSFTGQCFTEKIYPYFSPSLNYRAMASSSSLLSEDQLHCSICRDVFTDPVTTPCGHNFCLVCLTESWDSSSHYQCRVCKMEFTQRPQLSVNTFISGLAAQFKKSVQVKSSPAPEKRIKPQVLCDFCCETKCAALKSCLTCMASSCKTHLELHHTVASFKTHKLVEPVENLEDYICQKHERPLELFCRDDQTCVCQFCTEGDHRAHRTVPIEEEIPVQKIQIGTTQEGIHQMIQDRLNKIEEIKHSVELHKVSVKLHASDRMLNSLLNKNTEQEKADSVEVFRALVRCIERSQAELLELMEEKQKAAERQAEELIEELEQEITELKRRDTELEQLSHTEDHLHLLQVYPSLCRPPPTKDWTDRRINTPLSVENLRRALSQLQEELTKEKKKLPEIMDVTLDPDTAHPELILSDDGKQVRLGHKQQKLPDSPERFDRCVCVLGKEGFSSGRFYYEVQAPQKVGVFVDYEEGLVSFYDVEASSHIYSFT
ncbi:hypothetical protein NFI96_028577, partial [Prochilodus magdalenae]